MEGGGWLLQEDSEEELVERFGRPGQVGCRRVVGRSGGEVDRMKKKEEL